MICYYLSWDTEAVLSGELNAGYHQAPGGSILSDSLPPAACLHCCCLCLLPRNPSLCPVFFYSPATSGVWEKVRQRAPWKQEGSLMFYLTQLQSSKDFVLRTLAGAWPAQAASHAERWQDGGVCGK